MHIYKRLGTKGPQSPFSFDAFLKDEDIEAWGINDLFKVTETPICQCRGRKWVSLLLI